MRKVILLSSLLALLFGCQMTNEVNVDNIKLEIIDIEDQFQKMVATEGMQKAFVHFAAEDAVIKRGKSLFKGKEAIHKKLGTSPSPEKMKLTWKPDFVEVAQSGELAYTYGKYQLTKIDDNGNEKTSSGVFHTVWKMQHDGKWRYVWD